MNQSIAEQLADLSPSLQLSSDQHAFSEHSCTWDNIGLTVQDEPFDLASEIEPSVWDKYMPNDGTSRIEHRLRHQGLRKASDSTREPMQEAVVVTGAVKLRVLRQSGGEMYVSQAFLGRYDQMRNAAIERAIAKDLESYKDV